MYDYSISSKFTIYHNYKGKRYDKPLALELAGSSRATVRVT